MNVTITNGTLTAKINPKGAELVSLKDSKREYIWEGDPEHWGKHSPVLFPIVGTLKNNTYLYQGKVHALPRHGFARDNVFSVKEHNENSAVFLLVPNNETKRVYPFDFELELHYKLEGNTLSIEYKVTNTGDASMPFSIGAHPAFALPNKFSSYSLKFEKQEQLVSTQLENDLLSDKTIQLPVDNGIMPLDYDLFKNDALILKELQSGAVTLLEGENPLLTVTFEKFPHLGIWTKDKAPFICIEPWQGYSDLHNASGNITEKEGIITLEPGENHNTGLSIEIHS